MMTLMMVGGQLNDLPRREIYRYMDTTQEGVSPELSRMIEQLLPQFIARVKCRGCYAVVPVSIVGSHVDMDVLQTDSAHLARNLQGCQKAVLFVATLGMDVERQKRTAAVQSPLQALALDAMGSAAIEAYCNMLCGEIAAQYPEYKARPRFSPGYGDLSLGLQSRLLDILDARKAIGVTLTEGMLMVPQKSVTAIMGLGARGCVKAVTDCERCECSDCEFRL